MKKSIILLTIFVLMLFMASCRNSSTSDEIYDGSEISDIYSSETGVYDDSIMYGDEGPTCYTLSEYLNSGKTLIIYYSDNQNPSGDDNIPAKDDRITWIYVFQNNHMSVYNSYDSDSNVKITLGEVAKMTDNEVIAFCEESCPEETNIEYQLEVYTDGTGNFTDYECIIPNNFRFSDYYIPKLKFYNFGMNTVASIYNSTFFKLPTDDEAESVGFLYRPDGYGYTISLDTPDSENVIVDP